MVGGVGQECDWLLRVFKITGVGRTGKARVAAKARKGRGMVDPSSAVSLVRRRTDD
jgi:hypothetical protein